MIAITTPWDWTEVLEGIVVSVLFVLGPLLTHAEARHRRREREAERRHQELTTTIKEKT